ncbi:MAG: hypothetical protein JRF48_03220 [Deltaproteobacteria bacterium]|nr:hypothetical protein [Deltaproteobacteria bacterium]
MLDWLPAEGSFRQMRLAHASPGYRVFAVCSADSVERSMRTAHVVTRLMARERNLFCACAHRVGKKLHFFDRALRAHLAQTNKTNKTNQTKTNELEQQHQIQRRSK